LPRALPNQRLERWREHRKLDTTPLLWSVLFGSIGLGFLIYGRKQRAIVPLVCGLGLMIFPYFLSNTILLITIGIVLMAIPYFLRL
jgi:hypothetical protein